MLIRSIQENLRILSSRPREVANLCDDLSMHITRLASLINSSPPIRISGVGYTNWETAGEALLRYTSPGTLVSSDEPVGSYAGSDLYLSPAFLPRCDTYTVLLKLPASRCDLVVSPLLAPGADPTALISGIHDQATTGVREKISVFSKEITKAVDANMHLFELLSDNLEIAELSQATPRSLINDAGFSL